jgi:hypothetical protein
LYFFKESQKIIIYTVLHKAKNTSWKKKLSAALQSLNNINEDKVEKAGIIISIDGK